MSEAVSKHEGTAVIERTPNVIAAEIRSLDSQARKVVFDSAVEIGKRLHEAKAIVAHGEWGTWLEANVSYSQSTAINFMRVATEYADANPQTFGNLSYSQAVALLSVPSEERESFVAENNVESMSTRELAAAIKAKEEAERLLKESKEKEQIALQAHEKEVQKRKALEEKSKEQKQLIEQLEQAQASGDENAVEELRKDLEESKATIKSLETELKAKPIDIPKVEKVEVVPESVKKELEQLRQREQELAQQAKEREEVATKQLAELQEQLRKNNNTAGIKVKVHFKALTDTFKELMASVAELTDEEQQKAVKDRIAALCDEIKASTV